MEEKKPFYKTAEKGKFYMREAPAEEEKNLMRTYYPKTAGMIQAMVEDACDRLDYEGSFLYDEYPDKWSIERTCQRIESRMEMQMQSVSENLLGNLSGLCSVRRCIRGVAEENDAGKFTKLPVLGLQI